MDIDLLPPTEEEAKARIQSLQENISTLQQKVAAEDEKFRSWRVRHLIDFFT